MPDYQNSKIYKLVGNGKIYIGSTTIKLCRRRTQHITDYKRNNNCTSREIITDPGHYIELIEYYPCNNKEELTARERFYIQNNECVNKKIPGRTVEEYKEDNKEKIKEQRKKYYEANKEKNKKYYEDNKEKILERNRKYKEANKEK